MKTTNLPIPTVHLNGTSRNALVDQQKDVMTAARAFLEVLANARPHGRDYYVQAGDAYQAARAAHEAKEQLVQGIADEAKEIAMAIMDATR